MCCFTWKKKKKNRRHTTYSFLARALIFMDALLFYLSSDCSFCVARWWYVAFNYFFPFIISHLLRQAELHAVARSDLDMRQAKINILPLWHRWQIAQHAQSSAVRSSEGGQSRTGITQKERPRDLLHLTHLDIMKKCVGGLRPGLIR